MADTPNRYSINVYTNQMMMIDRDKIYYDNGTKIPLHAIERFADDILGTEKKNVFPTIFIHFIRNSIGLRGTKIEFIPTELQKIRLWSNAMRSKVDLSNAEKIYMSYKIGEEIIRYIKASHPEFR
jgi:hypothetical protein